jgi:hypothetical protein
VKILASPSAQRRTAGAYDGFLPCRIYFHWARPPFDPRWKLPRQEQSVTVPFRCGGGRFARGDPLSRAAQWPTQILQPRRMSILTMRASLSTSPVCRAYLVKCQIIRSLSACGVFSGYFRRRTRRNNWPSDKRGVGSFRTKSSAKNQLSWL